MRIANTAIPLIACLGILAGQSSSAAVNDAWEFEVTPYILAAGLDGEVGVRGVTADIDASFSDILDNLKGGFMGLFTARKGPWIYGLEAVYMKLEDQGAKSASGPFGKVSVDGALDLTNKMYIYQGSVGYRVLEGKTAVDLIGALRYTKLYADAEVKLTTVPGIVFPGGKKSASGSDSWVDAVIGVHALHRVSDNVSLVGYADVGGGGSDLTYQAIAGVNWEFKKDYTAKLGYRLLDWDYKDGGTVWDMTASGAYLGLGIQF